VGYHPQPVVSALWVLIPLKIVTFALDTRFEVTLISVFKWGKVG